MTVLRTFDSILKTMLAISFTTNICDSFLNEHQYEFMQLNLDNMVYFLDGKYLPLGDILN